jgi:hypothetical protein
MRNIIYFSYHEKSERQFDSICTMGAPYVEKAKKNGNPMTLWDRTKIKP